MCPPPSCPDYNPILNTFKSEGDPGFILVLFDQYCDMSGLCELYPEMVRSYCGLGTDCVSSGGTFNCVCQDGYEGFVPRVGCSVVKG